MHSKTTPKTHLVPVIKGVSDPAKGLIFRTYHVRPEQLEEALKKATTVPDKIHIPFIKLYSKLSKSIQHNDITHLRDLFSKDSIVWKLLVDRHIKTEPHHNKSKQKLMQSVYAHILSQDSVFEPVIKKHSAISSIRKQTVIQHKESEQKKNKEIKNTSIAVTEKVSLKPIQEEDELLKPVVLPMIHNKKALIAADADIEPPDYGKILTKSKTTVDIFEHTKVGNEMSSFLNFVNPSPSKIVNLHKALTGKAEDRADLAKNLILQPNIYKHDPEYWSDALSHDLIQYYSGVNTNIHRNSVLYSNLMLRNIDKKRFFALHSSVSDPTIAHILSNSNNIENVINGTVLSPKEKLLYIVSLNNNDITNNKHHIIEMAHNAYLKNNTNWSTSLIAAYTNHLNSDSSYRLVNTIAPYFFSPERIMYSTLEQGTNDPFSYLVTQLIASRSLKSHYVPYNEMHMFKDDAFTSVLAMKVAKEITDRHVDLLQNFYASHKYMRTNDVRVGIVAPNTVTADQQLFIRMHPAMVLDILPDNTTSEKYAVAGILKSNNIILQRNNKVLAYNPINSITFDS